MRNWSQCELTGNRTTGVARLACCPLNGTATTCKATEVLDFTDKTAGRDGPLALQVHNSGIQDEYRDLYVESPVVTSSDKFVTTGRETGRGGRAGGLASPARPFETTRRWERCPRNRSRAPTQPQGRDPGAHRHSRSSTRMSDLIIRPLRVGEEALFDSLPDPALVGYGALGITYAAGDYRPEWTWIAQRDGVVVARAVWWAGPHDTEPKALDWFDFTDHDAAVELLRTAPFRTEYSIPLPTNWRDDPATHAAATARLDAAKAAGMTYLVERYTYRWTPECGLPARSTRLEFRPEPDDDAIVDLFRRVNPTSLDAHVRRVIAEKGVDASVQEDLDYLRWMPSPREWWRLAYTPDGDLVGFTAPCYHYSAHVVGYIAVVPEQRGHGYALDLLAETTHLLAAEGAEKIVAGTDVTNVPMAKAFARGNYLIAHHRIDLLP